MEMKFPCIIVAQNVDEFYELIQYCRRSDPEYADWFSRAGQDLYEVIKDVYDNEARHLDFDYIAISLHSANSVDGFCRYAWYRREDEYNKYYTYLFSDVSDILSEPNDINEEDLANEL